MRNRQQVVLKLYNLVGLLDNERKDVEAGIAVLIVGITGQEQYATALAVLEANELLVEEII